MEFVEGETLARILVGIRDSGPGAATPFGARDEVAYFGNLAKAFADVADGLQHAHSSGVIHRDIKPSNLILDSERRLRILDFGLARLEGQETLTFSGDFVGTPLYMSPEQARRTKITVDHRTDVYSLGATMYEAICGRPPIRGRDHADTLSRIIEQDPVEPRKINPRTPRDLETIVLKCLRKDAGDRYRTAEALSQDLARFARGDSIEARAQSPVELWARRLHAHRVRMTVGVALVLLLALLGWLGLRELGTARRGALERYTHVVRQAAMVAHLGRVMGGEHMHREGSAETIRGPVPPGSNPRAPRTGAGGPRGAASQPGAAPELRAGGVPAARARGRGPHGRGAHGRCMEPPLGQRPPRVPRAPLVGRGPELRRARPHGGAQAG